ncbi:MAG TPA: hypothetical protein V6C58_14225 [Allocoleopsis sp.]
MNNFLETQNTRISETSECVLEDSLASVKPGLSLFEFYVAKQNCLPTEPILQVKGYGIPSDNVHIEHLLHSDKFNPSISKNFFENCTLKSSTSRSEEKQVKVNNFTMASPQNTISKTHLGVDTRFLSKTKKS